MKITLANNLESSQGLIDALAKGPAYCDINEVLKKVDDVPANDVSRIERVSLLGAWIFSEGRNYVDPGVDLAVKFSYRNGPYTFPNAEPDFLISHEMKLTICFVSFR